MDRETIGKFLTAAAKMYCWRNIVKGSHGFGDPVLCDEAGILYLVLWLEGNGNAPLGARLERLYKEFQETYQRYFEKYPDGWRIPTQEQNAEFTAITCQAFDVQRLLEKIVSILGGEAGKQALDAHCLELYGSPPWEWEQTSSRDSAATACPDVDEPQHGKGRTVAKAKSGSDQKNRLEEDEEDEDAFCGWESLKRRILEDKELEGEDNIIFGPVRRQADGKEITSWLDAIVLEFRSLWDNRLKLLRNDGDKSGDEEWEFRRNIYACWQNWHKVFTCLRESEQWFYKTLGPKKDKEWLDEVADALDVVRFAIGDMMGGVTEWNKDEQKMSRNQSNIFTKWPGI